MSESSFGGGLQTVGGVGHECGGRDGGVGEGGCVGGVADGESDASGRFGAGQPSCWLGFDAVLLLSCC